VTGAATDDPEVTADARHLATGFDLASYVHRDPAAGAYLDAAAILLNLEREAPPSPDLSLVDGEVQAGLVDFGPRDQLAAVAGVVVPAQRANWCQKWLVHRRLRLEKYAGLVHATAAERGDHPVPDSALASGAAQRVQARDGGSLLSQAYPEGAPLHPSYPAGHADIAGACVTVLKAFVGGS
jgi:membrane-associated phospholipid phosphatase